MRTSPKIRNLIASLAVLVIALVVAGCGGDSSESPSPPPPVSGAGGAGAKAVIPATTDGNLGQASKVTAGKEELLRGKSKIAPGSDKPTNSQKKGVAGADQCADTDTTPNDGNLGAMAQSVLCLVNAERAAAGLPALSQNGQLDQAAQGMANEMVEKVFFSHETPDGRNLADRVEPTGYIPNGDDWVLGENLAWGSGALSTPRAIVNGWMNSEGHKKNILDGSYRDVGLGTKMGSPSPSAKGGTVFVHNFGAKGGGGASAASAGDSGGGDAGAGDAGGSGDAGGNQAVAGAQAKAALKKCKARAKKAKSAAARRKAAKRCAKRRR